MAISLVQGPQSAYSTSSGTTVSVTLAGATAGNQLIAFAYWYGSQTIASITCTSESNLTVHGSPAYHASEPVSSQVASLASITTGGDKTFTATFSSAVAHKGIAVIEVSGGLASAFFDATNTNTGSSTTPSLSLTTVAANAMVVGVVGTGTGVTEGGVTAGGGYTGLDFSQGLGDFEGEYLLDAGVAGAKTVNFSMSPSARWALSAVSFDPAPVINNFSQTVTPKKKSEKTNRF